jgi:hypothetical protein
VFVASELPDCDFCAADGGRYDAKIDGVSGLACSLCYDAEGSGSLGASGDGYLMLAMEVPEGVREICDELRRRQGKSGIWGSGPVSA